MARPLRIIYENAFYHITARGNERRTIFVSDRDYRKFLTYLRDALQKYGCILHAFALMRNHYHLIFQTPMANLSSFMHSVNSAYMGTLGTVHCSLAHGFHFFRSLGIRGTPCLFPC